MTEIEYKIYELTGRSAMGTETFKVRASSPAQAMGMCDASVSDARRAPVADWDVNEVRTACFTHKGCDGADDTHEALKNL